MKSRQIAIALCEAITFLFVELFAKTKLELKYSLRRGGSRAAATSKMECFVIIVNGRSASGLRLVKKDAFR